jgi:hypothetical protein
MQSNALSPNHVSVSPPPNGPLHLRGVEPCPEPVEGKLLLDALARALRAHVVMSEWASDALALFIVHNQS